ncbi:hypothetical protein [Hoylesella buccalis]|uniref:Uncharacterized protein n=1 Tax=Hoylesella buccalis DNF00853 TaxID=1401074 RepID=A0A095ZGM5_9BACT|nr:hypothetical protein [Hoylesella buccalis]KGF33880.1 hypothetical protein HMPREF2137_09620 [Hoylesella buccalis DNF00853]
MDKTLTDKIVAWLNAPAHTEDADIMEGALMLLQLNRNRMLYMTISTNPKRFLKTVEYELKKFLPLRMKGKTCQDVRREADEFLSELRENGIDKEQSEGQDEMFETDDTDDTVAPVRNGKREDHDQLPQNIRDIWEANAARWKRIKEMYNTCLSIENPCDLEENLKVLKETYYAYKADYARYDSFTFENEGAKSEEDGASDDLKTLKDINNARSYISKNVDKLLALKKEALMDGASDEQTNAYQTLLSSMTQRVQTLVDNGQVMGEDLMNKLQATGINLPASQPSEENVKADE